MERLYARHKLRSIVSLDGLWRFHKAKNGEPCGREMFLAVPCAWESHPELCAYRGQGLYRREVTLDKDSSIRLYFGAVSHYARVMWDGQVVCEHDGAYTPFDCVLTGQKAGAHTLEVLADSSFDGRSALSVPNDYFTYGGITRGVELQYLPDAHIERVEFVPRKVESGWLAQADVYLRALTEAAAVQLCVGIAGKSAESTVALAAGEEKCVRVEISVEDITPWSPEQPQLYELVTTLSGADDDVQRVGFRTVECKDGHLYLNGEKLLIKGFNRHEDHPFLGSAGTLQALMMDLNLMRDMNANLVRTCHYPNHELLLDLCDEMGMLVWEEEHARGLSIEQMRHKDFMQQSLDCTREMIGAHISHPSVILWGLLNECESATEEGRAMYKQIIDLMRELDDSRPITFASCRHYTDVCLDLVDVVSFNIYPHWYTADEEDVTEFIQQLKDWIDTVGGAGKPFLISEFGAGAVYGYRSPTKVKWTEERQADIIRDVASAALNMDCVDGVIVWQFCDCRITEENNGFYARPKTQNNKGVVDIYRRPKMAYEVIKSIYGMK